MIPGTWDRKRVGSRNYFNKKMAWSPSHTQKPKLPPPPSIPSTSDSQLKKISGKWYKTSENMEFIQCWFHLIASLNSICEPIFDVAVQIRVIFLVVLSERIWEIFGENIIKNNENTIQTNEFRHMTTVTLEISHFVAKNIIWNVWIK